ncbi:hypothetical protein GCM10022393_34750 [Aquimarina addita]|uniref:Aminodeoxychorismate lyase n=2 Tax=Aquimarina addita TaxID=870485 RepID=A0ABP6UU86_9FLAO
MGLLAGGFFAFHVYQAVFSPNTNFETETVVLKIPAGTEYPALRRIIHPLLKETTSFDRIAIKKGYANHIKPGSYTIRRGWSNIEIIKYLSR